jgi:hypothetical protein
MIGFIVILIWFPCKHQLIGLYKHVSRAEAKVSWFMSFTAHCPLIICYLQHEVQSLLCSAAWADSMVEEAACVMG